MRWDKLEGDFAGKEPKFSKYFQSYIEEDMKNGMLLPIRRRAGLNDEFFYNNTQECSNAAFKGKVKESKALETAGYRPLFKGTWSEAIKIYRECVLQAQRDINRPVFGKGPDALNAQHQYLSVTDAEWSNMTGQVGEKHLQAFRT